MSEITFLSTYKKYKRNYLDILEKYGPKCAITDFAVLLGGAVFINSKIVKNDVKKYRVGIWWTKDSCNENGSSVVIDSNGVRRTGPNRCRNVGARPVLPYSSISAFAHSETIIYGDKEVEYGEYPQTIVDEEYSHELETAYNSGNLRVTGHTYTTDSVDCEQYDKEFEGREHTEYEYNGNKYIRFVGDSNSVGKEMSDGQIIKLGNAYWVRVEPIVWKIYESEDLALSKKIIFSGVQYKFLSITTDDNFENTDIKKFMDKYWSKEIVVDRNLIQDPSVQQNKGMEANRMPQKQNPAVNSNKDMEGNKTARKQNPYNFNFDYVSEEDIIRGAIESNISVFLHGKSSEGKSARVKQLDPDCEVIYMSNANPYSLNGKSVYNSATGEMIDIPPTWYKKIKSKCEAEPNKIHIVFFDELTNALPSIQGMAFNIILEGEIDGKWKLPSNARIVAAGNDLNDSLAANQMAEPLFNRFAHVYIKTTLDSWLKWAVTPKDRYERLDYIETEPEAKIHPSIYTYIAYKSYSGQNVLRTPYTGDKPNADPRKWEMASKVLYRTNQPEMLRALIGETLTSDFTAFAKQQVISVEDVINNNYTPKDLEMNVSQKFATAVGLSSVDIEHFEIVRDFMKQLGEEPRAAFESMWAHGDERRLEKIAEVQMADVSHGGIKL